MKFGLDKESRELLEKFLIQFTRFNDNLEEIKKEVIPYIEKHKDKTSTP